ncbi:putative shikimate dehydrogenase, 3-dehydroquinate dehydratase [Rosa chinensis]|uniref:Putative shikimate dehydrogenase, 3-dehydroquinate dehydratase n=1 Tax=Rosa chinensis TaxID=74649 RepID=A0A2P6RRP7_ROSCH|nr:putative shikimate dehydrogenase, 3-dehydroquinate dehydratase [Rosa chinensis]
MDCQNVMAQVGGGGMRKSSTLLCAPIMAKSVANMVVDIGRAKAVGADLVEIRLVHLKVFNSNEEKNPLCSLFSLIRYYYFARNMLCD